MSSLSCCVVTWLQEMTATLLEYHKFCEPASVDARKGENENTTIKKRKTML